MNAEAAIKASISEVPKAVAAGLVDMDSGMLLAVKTVDSHPQAVLDMVASATHDLFQGDNVMNIENMFKQIRGVTTSEHYFQEIIVASTNLWHFFGRLKQQPTIVLIVVTRQDVNLGLVLMKCREITANTKV